jgi:hypothetical protein
MLTNLSPDVEQVSNLLVSQMLIRAKNHPAQKSGRLNHSNATAQFSPLRGAGGAYLARPSIPA